jgi:hypothetical protein
MQNEGLNGSTMIKIIFILQETILDNQQRTMIWKWKQLHLHAVEKPSKIGLASG